MSVLRALHMYCLSLRQLLRRVYYDLAREFVVAICALVILATFFYVFNDFLNVQVLTVSSSMRDHFGEALSYALLITATVGTMRTITKERLDENSIAGLMARFGEPPTTITIYKTLRITSLIVTVFGLTWFVILEYLTALSLQQILLYQAASLAVIGMRQLFFKKELRPESMSTTTKNEIPEIKSKSKVVEMAHWRLKQLVRRNRLTQFCLAAAGLFLGLEVLLIMNHAPYFVLVFTAFLVGLFAAFTLAFQLQEDLEGIWAERLLGISHEEFVAAYQLLGVEIGVIFAAITAATYVALDPTEPLEALKLAVICLTPCLIIPLLLFQIDPRKPAIQIMLVILIGLFLVTAVYAHWLALILFWGIHYYGTNAQKGRFYRA
jgi:hypothetical protein